MRALTEGDLSLDLVQLGDAQLVRAKDGLGHVVGSIGGHGAFGAFGAFLRVSSRTSQGQKVMGGNSCRNVFVQGVCGLIT